MRQIREILRQKWTLGRSHREVAGQLGAGLGTVSGVERRARAAGLDWPQVEALTDEVLETRLYGPPRPPTHHRPVPDCAHLHAERHKPGVTLELLHLEYLEHHPDGYRYTQFCEVYRQWLHRRGRSMRQVHHAGDKCFVDYAGQKPRLIEAATGAVIDSAADPDHDLAEVGTALHMGQGGGRLGEGELAVNHWLDAMAGHRIEHVGEHRTAAHEDAVDAGGLGITPTGLAWAPSPVSTPM